VARIHKIKLRKDIIAHMRNNGNIYKEEVIDVSKPVATLHGPLVKQRQTSQIFRRMSEVSTRATLNKPSGTFHPTPPIKEESAPRDPTKRRKSSIKPTDVDLITSKVEIAKTLASQLEEENNIAKKEVTDVLELDRKERDEELEIVQDMLTYGRTMIKESKSAVKQAKKETIQNNYEKVFYYCCMHLKSM
jgi:hypothetical protein